MASHLTQNIIQAPPHNFQGPAVRTSGAAHLWSFSPSLTASSMFLRRTGHTLPPGLCTSRPPLPPLPAPAPGHVTCCLWGLE